MLLPDEHQRSQEFTSQGVEMSSQGENYESIKAVNTYLRTKNERLRQKVLKYKDRFGDLSDKSGESVLLNIDNLLDQPTPSAFTTANQENTNLNGV